MELYDWQREAIGELMDGAGRVLVVAPTGGGKSMTFQVPAERLDGVAIVITPLVALMADQVRSLEERGIAATYLAANLEAAENQRRARLAAEGRVKLLYLAPERLALDWFVDEVLAQLEISLVAIDEAHCISQWGHDFRPDYLRIGDLVRRLRPRRMIACTATATPHVRAEILDKLDMPDAKQILRGFARHNLRLRADEVGGPRAKQDRIAREVKRVLDKPRAGRGTVLVYTGSRRHAETTASALRDLGWRAEHYHAGMTGPERTRVQDRFQSGDLDVVAATNAFGMGIDRADIRLVVHHALPESVEAYYQEVGRAGRDGEPAEGLLLLCDPDISLRFGLIAKDETLTPDAALRRRELLRAMISYAETSACRHDAILEYFEDEAEELGGCSQCDNCVAAAEGRLAPEPSPEASADEVRTALSAIRGLPFAIGAGSVASYLGGRGTAQLRKWDLTSRQHFGALRHRNEHWTRRLLRRMLAAGLLAIDAERQTLCVTRRGADVTAGLRPNPVRLPPEGTAPPAQAGRATSAVSDEATALFEQLKAWRRMRADADGVPAYVVCHDATLGAIAEGRPRTAEELLAVPGMGPAKIQRYGVQILDAVRGAARGDGHDASGAAASPPEANGPAVDAAIAGDAQADPRDALRGALRAWRRRAAVASGVKLWEIAQNDALERVVASQPGTLDALRALEVLGDGVLERWGASLLAVVREHAGAGELPAFLRADEAGAANTAAAAGAAAGEGGVAGAGTREGGVAARLGARS